MLFFRLLEISVIHPAKCKLPSIREIFICMLVYAYENEVLKKKISGDSAKAMLRRRRNGTERDGTGRNGTERNGMERNDCVPILFCVQTGTQSFHHTLVRPGLCHTLDRPFIFFIAQSA